MRIDNVSEKEYQELIDVWEDSVRATHHFLTEKDIDYFKPIILEQAFPFVSLRSVKDQTGKILGFIGVHQGKIEMLFVLDKARHMGYGKRLIEYAIEHLEATSLDVNEQNPEAIEFYRHIGFKATSWSPVDDFGKPFPILHMVLAK